jgi:hypothetical protein
MFDDALDSQRRLSLRQKQASSRQTGASVEAEAEGGGPTWDRRRQAAPPQLPVLLPNRDPSGPSGPHNGQGARGYMLCNVAIFELNLALGKEMKEILWAIVVIAGHGRWRV